MKSLWFVPIVLALGSIVLFPAVLTPSDVGHSLEPVGAHSSSWANERSSTGVLARSGAAPAPPAMKATVDRSPIHPSTVIDPLSDYDKEPAPMGIADFGVNGAGSGAQAYEYTTPAFVGTANISTMALTVGSGKAVENVAAFELNANVVFQLDGTSYTYWVQNGLHVNTSSREFTIGGAYVWNFSAPGAHLSSTDVRGNASSMLASDTYYFIPGCGVFPGQCSAISIPSTIEGRINTSIEGGLPIISYQYDLGAGWVTYDTVAFPHLAGATIEGFEVNGFHGTPYAAGLFYDAEWVWVAAGGGQTGTVGPTGIQLGLSYWNGHNLQAVPNAWDFGTDTGETSTNVLESADSGARIGSPSAEVRNGSGTLGVVYNQTSVGFLNVTAPVGGPLTLRINGTDVPFVGGSANITIQSGEYGVSLLNYSGEWSDVEVHPGATTFLNLSSAGQTLFVSLGLPNDTAWTITVGTFERTTTNASVSFALTNGTYPVSYGHIPGFVLNASAPTSIKVPVPSPVLLLWSAFLYQVPIEESGLPAGAMWWANDSNQSVQGTGTSLNLSVPNGTTAYNVGSSYAFIASPANGTLTVTNGFYSPAEVQFSYRLSYIVGTVSPSNASVSIGGVPVTLVNGAFNDSVRPGEYNITAYAGGYDNATYVVNTTAGNVTIQDIALKLATPLGSTTPQGATSSPNNLPIELGVVVGAVVVVVAVVAYLRSRR